jgi:hypothetical protein
VKQARANLEAAVAHVQAVDNTSFRDHHAQALVEMGTQLVCSYLLLRDAQKDARKLLMAEYFIDRCARRAESECARIVAAKADDVDVLATLAAD